MLEIIVVAIFVATVLNLFFKKIKIPSIIGYIITGVIISYLFGLHYVAGNHELKTIAEFGVVFLMFTIGLEFSVKHLLNMKKYVFAYGGLQVFLTSVVFFLISHYALGFDLKTSIIIGTALSLSSTAIVLKILNENHDISKEYGQKSLGILLFQDLAVIPILLMIGMFSQDGSSISLLISKTLVSAILLIAILWFLGSYLLDIFLEKVSKSGSNELFISAILLIVLGSSYLAYYLGLSFSLGALIAGILIAETHYKHQVEADLAPFRDLLLGLFFVTVGMQLDFSIIVENLRFIVVLLPLIILIKILIIFGITSFLSKKRTAFKTALSLFQVGEFSIVIFELASDKNLIDHNLGQIFIVIIILSMIITPFVLKHISNIANLLSYVFCKGKKCDIKDKEISKYMGNDIVLIGYGRLGRIISELLEKNGYKYMIIESNHHIFKKAKKLGKPIIFGNAYQKHLLDQIKINMSSNIIISVGNNEKLYLICEAISSIAKDSKIIVKVNKYEEKEMLSKLNLTNIIVETEETALSMFNEIKKSES